MVSGMFSPPVRPQRPRLATYSLLLQQVEKARPVNRDLEGGLNDYRRKT